MYKRRNTTQSISPIINVIKSNYQSQTQHLHQYIDPTKQKILKSFNLGHFNHFITHEVSSQLNLTMVTQLIHTINFFQLPPNQNEKIANRFKREKNMNFIPKMIII